jgi:hypothetical protein
MHWRSGSNAEHLLCKLQAPEFKLQSHQKNKKSYNDRKKPSEKHNNLIDEINTPVHAR